VIANGGFMKSVWIVTILGLLAAGCDDRGQSASPTAPASSRPAPSPDAARLMVFTERGTGFSTTDLYDASDHVLQIDSAGALIWTADGTRMPGYRVETLEFSRGFFYFVAGTICPGGCEFEIRFGSRNGDRRAFLTVDYGHDNPGTLVDVAVANGALIVTQTTRYPPGSPTLTGVVTEVTPMGKVPVAGATVYRGVSTGWRYATTDSSGVYTLRGLLDGTAELGFTKDGYRRETYQLSISGDTRFDGEMTRTP